MHTSVRRLKGLKKDISIITQNRTEEDGISDAYSYFFKGITEEYWHTIKIIFTHFPIVFI